MSGTEKFLDWHPTPEEVQAILDEVRPVIAALARSQSERMARNTGRPAA